MDIKRKSIVIFVSFFLAISVYLLIDNISYFKIKHVQIESKMEFLDKKKVVKTLKDSFTGNFFTVSISNIQKKLLSLPYIKDVKITRVWPNTLKINITEIEAIARITVDKDKLYVLSNGCSFVEISENKYKKLQNLIKIDLQQDAENSYTQKKVCEIFKSIREKISQINHDSNLKENLDLKEIIYNSINSISLLINNSITINIGKVNIIPKDIETKLSKLKAFITKKNNLSNIKYVDLRYTNGIAVK